MKYEITKSFRFEACHSLPHLPASHQCSRNHGHSYELIVGVCGPLENEWVQDYADISAAVMPVVKRLDHYDLNDVLPCATTAENLAGEIFKRVKAAGLPVVRVRLYETVRGWAEVSE